MGESTETWMRSAGSRQSPATISPFGLRRAMPIYAQATIADLPRIYINGGARGFLVELATTELIRVLAPTLVDAATT